MAEAERVIGTPDGPDVDDETAAPAEGTAARPSGSAAGQAESGAGQAERAEPADQPGRPKGRRRIAALFTVALLAYLLDLGTKMLVVAKLEHHEPIEVIGDLLKFEAIRNPGAAFGVGEAFTVIFTIIAATVIVVIARLARKLYSLPWAIALGLLLGGALGNLTDRIFRSPGVFQGAVVDFIAPAHFAVFNLADSAIVCGGILIVLLSFRGLDPDGTVHKD
ncbi:signal peptidase II [Streptomyces sp. GMY02]|uniref:signal peptidase II n=1 Tax=Streptomyces sp. GMY02 TaxID=1333528 RepID=UPI001C2C0D82|nr:signal peptidase II [Streptomyces sp. GMY02]QXE37341.1 signal peptidase II [Streptomyces sp. GMY02]